MTDKKQKELSMVFLHQLARNLMFELDDEQCHKLWLEFEAIEQQMENVIKINTDNVLPLSYPFAINHTYLRPDKIAPSLPTKAVLAVAPAVLDHYIVINKVISNED